MKATDAAAGANCKLDPDGPRKDDMDTDAGEKADRNSVNTGDYENLFSWVTLLILSSLLLALTAVIRRKQR